MTGMSSRATYEMDIMSGGRQAKVKVCRVEIDVVTDTADETVA